MKRIHWSRLVLACVVLVCSATTVAESVPLEAASGSTSFQLLSDPKFENGFNLLGTRSIETGSRTFDLLNYGRPGAEQPSWRLAQWGTRHSLQGTSVRVIGPGVFQYANRAKSLTADTIRGELTLRVNATREYLHPRKANEDWPHLLVEQYFTHKPMLTELQQLRVKFQAGLSHFHNAMTTGTYDPGLHAAQLQMYLTVQNCDTSSSAAGDYLWFGLVLFDNREDVPKESYHKDGGKEDTTHKFIYIMPSSGFLVKGLRAGDSARVDVDVMPYIWKAYSLARGQGFLGETSREQLAVSGMNFGWELPGTFDVEARIRDLEVIAITNKR